MVKTGFSKNTVPELRLRQADKDVLPARGKSICKDIQMGDHDGTFRSFQGFSLAGTGEGLLSVWQVMSLKQHSESMEGFMCQANAFGLYLVHWANSTILIRKRRLCFCVVLLKR